MRLCTDTATVDAFTGFGLASEPSAPEAQQVRRIVALQAQKDWPGEPDVKLPIVIKDEGAICHVYYQYR